MMKTTSLLQLCMALLLLTAGLPAGAATDGGHRLSVFHLNVWMSATRVPDGFKGVADEIAARRPDVVTLCEVNKDLSADLCRELKQRGVEYRYVAPSSTVVVLSRYPVVEGELVDSLKAYRSLIRLDDGQEVAVYSAHLDYTHYACYLPRGYDGVTWKECNLPASTDEILAQNDASLRPKQMKHLLARAAHDEAQGRPVIVAGDFNEPSWLDWQADTKDLYDHRGFVVPWTTTLLLHEAGYRDAYRTLYPSAVTHPGFTWVSGNEAVSVDQLAWAPKSDERDRIDFVFYKGKGVTVEKAAVVGPRTSVVRGKRVDETSQDPILEPVGTWPSDHKGVWVELCW